MNAQSQAQKSNKTLTKSHNDIIEEKTSDVKPYGFQACIQT